MNILRKWIRNVFGFSGREINGFLILLPLTLIIIVSEPIKRAWLTNRTDDFSEDRKKLDSLAQLWSVPVVTVDSTLKSELFVFDPNKTSETDLQRLGFSENLSSRIASYRQKGGKFRFKSDLMKIYGLDSSFYSQLYAYILLPEHREKPIYEQREKVAPKSQKERLASFDLNRADTTELESVYGIGRKLAARIIRFRDGLGGFIHAEQVKEVYGLDTTVVHELLKRSFITTDFIPKQINLNTANESELSVHPYIRKFLAKTFVAYRFQHGKFNNVEELKKITVLKPEDFEKIVPYLKLTD